MPKRPLIIQGAPGSPYTRKMLAVLRYRHIPYRYINRLEAEAAGLPKPKVELLPTFYFPKDDGAIEVAVDSTPLIRRLEADHAGRSILPPDPAVAFLDALIEDFGDEWLTKAMFHYRWHHAADRRKAGLILPRHAMATMPDEQLAGMAQYFTDRQVGRLRYVGSNDTTAPVIEASFARFVTVFDAILGARRFLFGARPAAADFALFGQLTQLALFDPTSAAVTLEKGPRVLAWTETTEDLSGVADDAAWLDRDAVGAALKPLLIEIGRGYTPVLLANEAAIAAGQELVRTEVDGQEWVQNPFPYHVKCLIALRDRFAALTPADQSQVRLWLEDTGVARLLG